MKITSPDNSVIKYLKRLQTSSGFRRREKKFLVEGPNAIRSLFEKGIRADHLYISPETVANASFFHKAREQYGIPFTELSGRCFEKISDVEAPQGVAALYSFIDYDVEKILRDKDGIFLCCHGIQDPGNLGTMIRSADAAGASAVIAIPPCASFYNPKSVRASAGSVLSVPCLDMEEEEFAARIKKSGIDLYAALPREGTPFHSARFQRPLCVLIGSEAHGLPDRIKSLAKPVTIPMRNAVESLNAAIASAIILYDAALKKEK